MTTRNRKNHFYYANHTRRATDAPCQFCHFSPAKDEILEQTKTMWVVRNLFPYDVWDISTVKDHLMIVPKRHIDSVSHFNGSEQTEFMRMLAKYEAAGYSVYARAPTNKMKSVIHQHTHLIKLGPKVRSLIYVEKPRLLLAK